jgi:hypothetical protein
MEPEDSLLCSQQTSTGPYHEPDESSPYHSTLFLLIVVKVLGYRSRGPGSIPGATRFSEK